ncbi:hypothetical protein L9F63_018636, partial [Diploptera punctata]
YRYQAGRAFCCNAGWILNTARNTRSINTFGLDEIFRVRKRSTFLLPFDKKKSKFRQ